MNYRRNDEVLAFSGTVVVAAVASYGGIEA